MKLDDAAIVIYEAWRTSVNAVAWDDLPRYRKDQATLFMVEHATKGTPKEVLHDQWVTSLKSQGWTHGETESEELKTSPYILPYRLLPTEYTLFCSLVESLTPILSELFTKYTEIKSGHRAVRFIGRGAFFDRLYDSGLEFIPGQVRAVPEALARNFLNHKDLFEPYSGHIPADDTEQVLDAASASKDKEVKANIERALLVEAIAMLDTKQAIADFALAKFNKTLDKRLSVDALRDSVMAMVDYFGEPE